MTKRRTISLAAATAILGGLSVYGATATFASGGAPTPSTSPAISMMAGSGHHVHSNADKAAMIRRCTDQLPANERAKARQQMGTMMSSGSSGSTTTSTPSADTHGHWYGVS
jgi:hypothetical protein